MVEKKLKKKTFFIFSLVVYTNIFRLRSYFKTNMFKISFRPEFFFGYASDTNKIIVIFIIIITKYYLIIKIVLLTISMIYIQNNRQKNVII